jgi:predicted GNAT family acetyltransferase
MQLHRFNHPQTFYDRTQAYLLQHEAEHNLLLLISHTLIHYPDRYPNPPYLVAVERSGEMLGIAIRTQPHKLLLSKFTDLAGLKLVVEDTAATQKDIPGVSGLIPESDVFVQGWQSLTQQSHELTMAMRIHQLTNVQPIATPPGKLRPATQADRSLLVNWYQAFLDEVKVLLGDNAERTVDRALERETIFVWENDVPVSFACGGQSRPLTGRIGPVYTPPAYRRQGYATACVAALSQRLLKHGCQRCFLFTDLANPTSNHIYQTIGYRAVCDWNDYSFISPKL